MMSPAVIPAALASEFKRTFGVNVTLFWDVYTGFDAIAFDLWLQVPDGVSTSDYIKQNFSERSEFICRIIMSVSRVKA